MKIKLLLLLVLLSFAVNSQAGISTLLSETVHGDCKIKVTHDAVEGEDGLLIIRSRKNKYDSCKMTSTQVTQALTQGLKEHKNSKKLSAIRSIFLGRLQSYPWLRAYLIDQSKNNKQWNSAAGKPKKGSSNAYVNKLLNSGSALQAIKKPLAGFGYHVTGVSCEKILINKNKLPFDAMCWIKIKQ